MSFEFMSQDFFGASSQEIARQGDIARKALAESQANLGRVIIDVVTKNQAINAFNLALVTNRIKLDDNLRRDLIAQHVDANKFLSWVIDLRNAAAKDAVEINDPGIHEMLKNHAEAGEQQSAKFFELSGKLLVSDEASGEQSYIFNQFIPQ